jgi:hypothetical protein
MMRNLALKLREIAKRRSSLDRSKTMFHGLLWSIGVISMTPMSRVVWPGG